MEDRLTIAYLIRPAEGGIKSHLLALLSGLDSARFKPVVICPPTTSLFREVQQAGHEVIPLDLVGELNPVKDTKAVLRLRQILRRLNPDVLHIHSAKAGLVGRLAAALLARRPKVVLTVHSFVFDGRIGPRKRAVVAWVERCLSRVTDWIIAVSRALKEELISEMHLHPERITVIYNGVMFHPASRSAGAGLRIGTVARLAPQKGVDHLIRAAAIVLKEFPSATFLIIGDGPLRRTLETLADDVGARDNMEFLGFRPDALSIVAGLDVFVLASTREAFGLTLVEALSQQVPVVASRTGGIPEIVDGSTTGLLAEPGDAEDIAQKICRLLEDRRLADRIAREGCRSVRSRFTSDRMVNEIQDLYLGLASDASRPVRGKSGQQ